MSWRFSQDGWILTDTLRPPGEDPEQGSHICWVSAGQFCVSRLEVDDVLSIDGKEWIFRGVRIGTEHIIFSFGAPLPVHVKLRGGQAELSIERNSWPSLRNWERMELSIGSGATAIFRPHANVLHAILAIDALGELPDSVAVHCAGDHPACDTNVQWFWAGQYSLGALDFNGNGTPFPEGLRYQKSSACLLIDSVPPAGLSVGGVWRLGPGKNGVCPLVDFHDTPVTVAELIRHWTIHHSIEIRVPRMIAAQPVTSLIIPRCCATLTNERTLGAEQCRADAVPWSYGPENPFYPGGTEPRLQAFWLEEGRVRSAQNSRFAGGNLPASISAGATLIYTRNHPGQVSGFLTAACPVGNAQWRASHIVGPHIVCWRGFIDSAKLHQFRFGDSQRTVLLFDNGFVFEPWLWFAAPFAGIAMDCHSHWWAPMYGDQDARCSAAEHWQIDGEWLDFDRASGTIAPMPAMQDIRTARYMCFFDGEVSAASGAILYLEPGKRFPRLSGFFSDQTNGVWLPGGARAVLGSEECAHHFLPNGSEPDQQSFAPVVQAAFRSAISDRRRAAGQINGFSWRRTPDGIEVHESARDIGIYIADPVNPRKSDRG